MWISKVEDKVYYYVLGELLICKLHFITNNKETYFAGEIFKKRLYPTKIVTIRGKDLDVAKLKCLLRARELGWEVNKIN